MKAAILCPGPSLPDTWLGRTDERCIISVNRAVISGCDFWAFVDWQTFDEVSREFGPQDARRFTTREAQRNIQRRGGDLREEFYRAKVTYFEDIKRPDRIELQWSIYSATAACALAVHLGATDIRLYGADMCGTQDFDGAVGSRNNRTPGRWKCEVEVLEKLQRWCDGAGISVKRVLPDGNL